MALAAESEGEPFLIGRPRSFLRPFVLTGPAIPHRIAQRATAKDDFPTLGAFECLLGGVAIRNAHNIPRTATRAVEWFRKPRPERIDRIENNRAIQEVLRY